MKLLQYKIGSRFGITRAFPPQFLFINRGWHGIVLRSLVWVTADGELSFKRSNPYLPDKYEKENLFRIFVMDTIYQYSD